MRACRPRNSRRRRVVAVPVAGDRMIGRSAERECGVGDARGQVVALEPVPVAPHNSRIARAAADDSEVTDNRAAEGSIRYAARAEHAVVARSGCVGHAQRASDRAVGSRRDRDVHREVARTRRLLEKADYGPLRRLVSGPARARDRYESAGQSSGRAVVELDAGRR